MLLFEFFPLFVALVGVAAAIALFLGDRRARNDPNYHEAEPARPVVKADAEPEQPGRRPSMMP